MFSFLVSNGQNISITFTATGADTQIDSITATNLSTNESITFPGNGTLLLTVGTGIPTVSEYTNRGMIFPNPFSGRATFTAIVENPQTIWLSVQNLAGQVVVQTKAFVQPGEHEFDLSVNQPGIYLAGLTTEQGTSCYKVICTDATESENRILYRGSASNNQNNQNNFSQPGIKASQLVYPLRFTISDLIHYRCMRGNYVTVLANSPSTSTNTNVGFDACTDPDGKNYSVVLIGTQTWMAENLAYLPSVSPPTLASETISYYYVYSYAGTVISAAKATANYAAYGVLYNWAAAKTACPSGWHLPGDQEWTILTNHLGTTAGGKMKETGTAHWRSGNTGATNESGFTARPGGDRYGTGFYDIGEIGHFWSSSPGATTGAYIRFMSYNNNSVSVGNSNPSRGYSVRCLKN